jgi:hypothetical protein
MVMDRHKCIQRYKKAREFHGKLTNSSLSKHAKWLAVEAMIEPSLMYPLVTTFFSDMDI